MSTAVMPSAETVRAWTLRLALVAVLALQCTAWAAEAPPSNAAGESFVYALKIKEAAQTAGPVAVGQKIEIRAEGNATTGYQWSVKELKGDAVKSGGEVTYIPTPVAPDVNGAGGTYVIHLEGAKPGKAEVTLIYVRSFEKDKPPANTVKLTIEVQAAKGQPAGGAAKRDKPLTVAGKADPRSKMFIVLFENSVDPNAEVARLEKELGFTHKYIYSMPAFKGFAAEMSAEALEKLRWESNVKSIEHDGTVTTQGAGGMGTQ
jgi:predicted secreted protein